MASEPKKRALIAQIEAMPGGWDDIFAAIEDGATWRMLAEKFKVSRAFMHRVVVRDDEARRKRAEEAYRIRADALVDESLEIADAINVNLPAEAQKAKLQIELRKWLASIDNARYQRAEAKVNVNLNIGELHLGALRRRSTDPNTTIEATVTEAPALPAYDEGIAHLDDTEV